MGKIKIALIIVLCLAVMSCDDNKNVESFSRLSTNGITKINTVKFTQDNVPYAQILTGQNLGLSRYLTFPLSLLYNDPYLILSDRGLDSMIHVFNANNYNYIKPLGRKGYGPNEIMTTSRALSLNNISRDNVWAYDLEQRRFSKFNLSKFDSSLLADKQYTFREGEFTSFRVGWSNRNTLIGLTVDGESIFTEYDTTGKELKRYGDYDIPLSEKYSKGVIAQFYQGLLRSNEDNSLFVHSSLYIDQLEVLDLDNNVITQIIGPDQIEPRFEVVTVQGSEVMAVDPKETHHGYLDVYIGEYIYGLYSGQKWNGNPNGKDLCNEIYVFNKGGKIIQKFVLSELVRSITVDEKNGHIYAISSKDIPDVIRYDFSITDIMKK